MAKKYKILQQYITPEWSILPGTIGTPTDSINNTYQFEGAVGKPKKLFYEDFIKKHPDWFELVEEPQYTRSDMINFARCCGANKGADLNAALDKWHEIQNDFIAQMECKNPVNDLKWTDKQLIEFGRSVMHSSLWDKNHLQEFFNNWKKENGYE